MFQAKAFDCIGEDHTAEKAVVMLRGLLEDKDPFSLWAISYDGSPDDKYEITKHDIEGEFQDLEYVTITEMKESK